MRNNRIVLASAALFLAGCATSVERSAVELTGADPHRGAETVARYGCGSCHTIDGISGANGLVGPPLTGIANRMYIAGVLPNTPQNLVRWIQDPKQVNDKTAMPKLGLNERDAGDVAAYLYTIR